MTTTNAPFRDAFYDLADALFRARQGDERLSLAFDGEESDFVRLNHGRVRQPGRVAQRYATLQLVRGQRHSSGRVSLSGEKATDLEQLRQLLGSLRAQVEVLPEDPYLLLPEGVRSTEQINDNRLPAAEDTVAKVLEQAEGLDLVGIWASGDIHAGFASSEGQRNWFSSSSFHLDFSAYRQSDKAVKGSYAGFEWSDDAFAAKLADMKRKLEVLSREPKTLSPGRYRVFLTPTALEEILGVVGWGGFGLKARKTKQTSLLKMSEAGARLHPGVTLVENTKDGVGPGFTAHGFLKPDRVTLIKEGALGDALVSPRSGKEYGVPHTGWEASEEPHALELAPGSLKSDDALKQLDTGLWIGNLWYLNYSDRQSCRITGMTRFATFWVEGGEIRAPVNVMRFDETVYRMLGDNLEGFTEERELLLDASSYGARSTKSSRLPGALVKDFTFTL